MDYKRQLEEWLRLHPPQPKEEPADQGNPLQIESQRRRALRRMEPQERLDLHGFTVDEARRRADEFLRAAQAMGLSKVLIIHGKGNHSEGGRGVLKGSIRDYLASHPLAGETGIPDRAQGGEGAVWVILRPRGYRSR